MRAGAGPAGRLAAAGEATRAGAALRTGTALAILATGAAVMALAVGSLGWPLVHDGPLMHYIAQRLLAGDAPYRDLFDMNMPGAYLLHAAGLVLFGQGGGGFRALDLAVLAVTLLGLAAALSPFGAWAGSAAVALFALYHLAAGAWNAGQRDLVLCLPLAWASAALVAHVATGRIGLLGMAAVALGAGVCIKPHGLLLAPLLVLLAWRCGPGRRLVAGAAVLCGLAGPIVVALAWVARAGGLPAFADVVAGYLVPLYSRVGREGFLEAARLYRYGLPALAGVGGWALAGLLTLASLRRLDGRAGILVAGLGYGVLHFVGQGKGWEYHLYPAVLFGVALGAAGLGSAIRAGRPLAGALLVGILAFTAASLAVKGAGNVEAGWIAAKVDHARALADALRSLVSAGETIQVLDTTGGGIHALYLLGARQPTRFLYDFHFYHDVETPYVQRLRAELLAGLAARPPAAVVLFEHAWPTGGYERLDGFPELAAWLGAHYHVLGERDGYRIYAARRDR
jgi:hypothetical protein